jgi:SOS-response transcriptional repressor LexA
MSNTSDPKLEWAKRILALRRRLQMSQSDLGEQMNASAMAVSRWERGVQEPPASVYIQLGNLTGDPECWFFWGQAGLRSEDLMRVLPAVRSRMRQDRKVKLEVVRAGSHRTPRRAAELVAIPVLPIVAATHGGTGDPVDKLHQVPPEAMLAAPSKWCPNPAYTSCLRVRGRSMMPLIHDGYIIVIDTSQTNHPKLYGQIVVAAHKEHGLIVSRLQRFDHTEVLVPENREYESTAVSTNGWRIVAKILWWIGRPN